MVGKGVEHVVGWADKGGFAIGARGRWEPGVVLCDLGLTRVEIEDGLGIVFGEIGVFVLHVADKLGRAACVDGVFGAL